jgi:hypothetical protein
MILGIGGIIRIPLRRPEQSVIFIRVRLHLIGIPPAADQRDGNKGGRGDRTAPLAEKPNELRRNASRYIHKKTTSFGHRMTRRGWFNPFVLRCRIFS